MTGIADVPGRNAIHNINDCRGFLNRSRTNYDRRFITKVSERRKLIESLQENVTYYYDVIYWLDRLSYPTKKWQMLFAQSLAKHLDRPYRRDWLRD